MTLANTFIQRIAQKAAEEIDFRGSDKGISYDGLVFHNGWWYPANSAATCDVLVSVSISDEGETFRVFRRGYGTFVTSDFNQAETYLSGALGIIH